MTCNKQDIIDALMQNLNLSSVGSSRFYTNILNLLKSVEKCYIEFNFNEALYYIHRSLVILDNEIETQFYELSFLARLTTVYYENGQYVEKNIKIANKYDRYNQVKNSSRVDRKTSQWH